MNNHHDKYRISKICDAIRWHVNTTNDGTKEMMKCIKRLKTAETNSEAAAIIDETRLWASELRVHIRDLSATLMNQMPEVFGEDKNKP